MKLLAHMGYDECKELWNRLIPQDVVTDIWDVRDCFHRTFNRELFFVTAEDEAGEIKGFLPLCYVPETATYAFFPGETWHGKTWLEQNRLIADSDDTLNAMLELVKRQNRGTFHIRYLSKQSGADLSVEDETGYLFTPSGYNYSMDEYYAAFRGKNAKRLKREIASFDDMNIKVVINNFDDFDVLADMNVSAFGNESYFSDERFRQGFKNMMLWFRDNGMLRMTSVMIDGRYAAIDMGSIYKNVYTLMAGGTNSGFPGIAKYINTYHLRYSCEQKFDQADFLCGNFSWKTMFHLEPRPLYKVSNTDESVFDRCAENQHGVCVA